MGCRNPRKSQSRRAGDEVPAAGSGGGQDGESGAARAIFLRNRHTSERNRGLRAVCLRVFRGVCLEDRHITAGPLPPAGCGVHWSQLCPCLNTSTQNSFIASITCLTPICSACACRAAGSISGANREARRSMSISEILVRRQRTNVFCTSSRHRSNMWLSCGGRARQGGHFRSCGKTSRRCPA